MTGMPLHNPGEIPDYVPPHLRNEVFDFRNEPDGGVSFWHPRASLGLDPETSRVKLTKEQYQQTFDPHYRGINFTESMNNQYAPLQRHPKTTARSINEGIGKALRKAFDWGTSEQGKAVGTAGLLAALLGGAGGYAWGRHSGEGSVGKALLMALLAGGVGAAGTAYAQNRHNAREAWLTQRQSPLMGFSKTASAQGSAGLIRLLEGDPTLSAIERAQIIEALVRIPAPAQDEMYRLARTAAGAGVGMLIMRLLKAKGLLPILAGGILGAIIGSPPREHMSVNDFGQPSMRHFLS